MYQQGTVSQGLHTMQMHVKENNFMGCISNSSMDIIKVILTRTGANKSFKRKKTQKLPFPSIKRCDLTQWICKHLKLKSTVKLTSKQMGKPPEYKNSL